MAAAAGGLTLTDRTVSGTVRRFNINGGRRRVPRTAAAGSGSGGGFTGGGTSNFNTNSFTVNGVDIANGELGPLSHRQGQLRPDLHHGRQQQGRRARRRQLRDANKLKVGSTIAVGNSKGTATNFTVVGIVSEPAGDNPSDVYIPLGVAQSLANLKNDVNTIYVSATSSNDITSVASSISQGGARLDRDRPEHASPARSPARISSAASLANNLGKWLAIAVLIAAFLLASLLTMSAVIAADP